MIRLQRRLIFILAKILVQVRIHAFIMILRVIHYERIASTEWVFRWWNSSYFCSLISSLEFSMENIYFVVRISSDEGFSTIWFRNHRRLNFWWTLNFPLFFRCAKITKNYSRNYFFHTRNWPINYAVIIFTCVVIHRTPLMSLFFREITFFTFNHRMQLIHRFCFVACLTCVFICN